jgi:hypothetical protein
LKRNYIWGYANKKKFNTADIKNGLIQQFFKKVKFNHSYCRL